MFWMVICVFVKQDFNFDDDIITHWGYFDHCTLHVTISAVYFMFTSISSVGLGDIHPLNDIERLFCTFTLLFGVLMISVVLNVMREIYDTHKKQTQEISENNIDNEKLAVFLSTMKKFNGNVELKE